MFPFVIRPVQDGDREAIARIMTTTWGSSRVVSRGRVHDVTDLPGFVALRGEQLAGLVSYCIEGSQCEIVSLNSLVGGLGIGTALIEAVKRAAGEAGCSRVWLITTNDNTHALRFYQKRGFTLAALHKRAIEESRRLKPEISLTGIDGIPLRDEIELESVLES